MAAGFLWLSVHKGIYAPGARHFARLVDAVFGERPDRYAAAVALRKIYSVAAFTVVGCFAGWARSRSAHRVRDAAIAVALLSAVIEIVQKAAGSPESLASNAFDVGCGALGGALGGLLTGGNQRRGARRHRRM